jgi:RNA polymerase sigma-70 factor (ECF subfamily)
VDRWRAESSRTRLEKRCDRSAPVAGDVDDQLTATWLSDRVRQGLGKLPAEQREAVVLAYYGDRSYRQVAVELCIPEGTAKSRVRLGLAKLDTLLRSELIDEDAPAWI